MPRCSTDILFVAGPQGSVEYDANGAVVRRFRTGLELPPSGIVGLTVGVLAAASEPGAADRDRSGRFADL